MALYKGCDTLGPEAVLSLGGHYRTIGNELFGVIFGAWNVMSVQQVFGCGSMSLDLAELPSSSVQPTPYDCVFSGDIN